MKKAAVILCLFLFSAVAARAQISVTTNSYSETFDSMGTAGTTTPTGWRVGTTANTAGGPGVTDTPTTTGDWSTAGSTVVVGTGSSSTGGNYNFGVTGTNPADDRALGSLASSSLQRDTYVAFTNNTGMSIAQFDISYDGEQWRDGSTTTNVLTLQFSTNGTNFINLGSAFNFTSLQNTASGPLDGNAPANRTAAIGGTFVPTSAIGDGSTFYFRWADPDDGGSDHGMAIDNFSVAFTLVPEPSTYAMIGLGGLLLVGMQRFRRKS